MVIYRFGKRSFIILFLLIFSLSSAQIVDKPIQDSVVSDKGKFLEKLEKNKNKNGFNRLIHSVFVRDPKSKKAKETSKKADLHYQSFYKGEGKIIRNIHIETHDPFGYSLADTLREPKKFIEKAGDFIE